MSEAASAYYQARAETLGIEQVPQVLDGQPMLLLSHSSDALAIHSPRQDMLARVTVLYDAVVEGARGFVEACARARDPSFEEQMYGPLARANSDHVIGMVEKLLFPSRRRIRAGYLSDIQIEAIARHEVTPEVFNRATQNREYLRAPEAEQQQAFLLTSAELHSGGRSLGRVACFTMVGVDPERQAIRYLGASYTQTDLLAASALWQSRAVARVVTPDVRALSVRSRNQEERPRR